jgi:ABC-2 type transport system permease protein
MIMTIAKREFKSFFLSPMAWSLLAIVQFVTAYLFLSQVEAFNLIQPRLVGLSNAPGIADVIIAPLFGNVAIILLLITPLLTMRLISEERRNKTLALLFSAPVSNTQIILGKFLAVFALLSLMVFLISLMPLTLWLGATLDFGKFTANILALLLLLASYIALGVYMSSIAQQPIIAAMSTFGLLFLLWILDWGSTFSDKPSPVMGYLSILKHFQAIQTGAINSVDILYFMLFISSCLTFSILRLENERLQKM